jgi:hypothetical protein
MIKTVVSQEHWDTGYRNFYFYTADDCITEKVDSVIDKFMRTHPIHTCFEVGCFTCFNG